MLPSCGGSHDVWYRVLRVFFLLHILIIYRVCFVEVSAGVVTLGIHYIQVWGPNTGRVGTLWRGSTEEGHEGDPRAGAALL